MTGLLYSQLDSMLAKELPLLTRCSSNADNSS
jgi:hypothetical protein